MSRICLLTLSFSLVSSAALAQAPPEVTTHAILGIEIGMPIERVREIVADFGTPDSRPTRDGGTKEVWRLTRTGFAWLAMKANRDGRLVWLTGHRRSGQEVPFDAVGAPPSLATHDTGVWNSQAQSGPLQLTLRGRNRAALVVTLSEVKSAVEP